MVAKLITPVVFEDKLRGLESVLPLHLADEVKGSIDLAVLDRRPVDNSGRAVGVFARGCRHGSLITKRPQLELSHIEDATISSVRHNVLTSYEFTHKVKYVLLWYNVGVYYYDSGWFTPGDVKLAYAYKDVFNLYSFSGRTFWFKISFSPSLESSIILKGIY